MHANLLRDIIERQAGTLDKAVLEDVMNLIEAGATRGDITIKRRSLVIKDDGKGFESRQEIIDAFETFGKSDERKEENKRWARFQIGRGQMLAWGKVTYRTRTFEMTVDIRDPDTGCGYRLKEGLPDAPGCTITAQLYEPLDAQSIVTLPRRIAENVKYVDIPIYVNGKQVNRPPEKEKWSLVDDDGFYRFNESANSIAIYNLGVYVRHVYRGGIGGVAVSRRQLDVNFARNDVLESCPVFKRIMKHFRSKGQRSLLERKTFIPEQVVEVLANMESGLYTPHQVANLRLFRTVTNKTVSCFEISRQTQISFSELGDDRADKAMAQRRGLMVLSLPHLSAVFGTNQPKEIYTALCDLLAEVKALYNRKPAYVRIEDVHKTVRNDAILLDRSKLTKVERLALKTLSEHFEHGLYSAEGGVDVPGRTIHIGRMEGWRAWTNGHSFIAIEQDVFAGNMRSLAGWIDLSLLIAHEYAHTSDDRTHDADFYERFHEYAFVAVQHAASCFRNFTKRREKAGLQGILDRSSVHALERAEGEFIGVDPDDDPQPPTPKRGTHRRNVMEASAQTSFF